MDIINPELNLPEIELQYIIKNGIKKLRILSQRVDQLILKQLNEKKIRIQVWLEREGRRKAGNKIKRSWVHSNDNSNIAPAKLFSDTQYQYGGGLGWGWKTENKVPSYSTTNGYVPTEFEISSDNIVEQIIDLEIPALDIFTNILKRNGTYAKADDLVEELALLGRQRAQAQPIRARLMVNYKDKALKGRPSNVLNIGIHRDKSNPDFDPSNIKSYLKISYR